MAQYFAPELWIWIGFIALVLVLLALDLGVFHKKQHVIGAREALGWTAFWIALSLIFNVFVYFAYNNHWLGIGVEIGDDTDGKEAALMYLAGYVVEKSLSLDNIFVIALIFSYFHVPAISQHRVLFWGILGAMVMRGVMIIGGALLLESFSWMVYVFGGFLIATAVKLMLSSQESIEPEKNPLLKLAKRMFPLSDDYQGNKFFTRLNGRRAMTPLFLVLVLVESTDVLFAVDSIPAIFAITTDPFLVFTSNIFAILGLRSLYFALAAVMDKFRYLKNSLVFVLAFIGVKMMLAHHYPIPTMVSLSTILGILLVGIVASLIAARREPAKASS